MEYLTERGGERERERFIRERERTESRERRERLLVLKDEPD